MSDLWSTSFPSTCSGLPVLRRAYHHSRRPSYSSPRATGQSPKSMIRAFPSSSTMMFWGLRSRWTTPSLCASSRPLTYLPGDADGLAGAQPADLPDELLFAILAMDILHGDISGALVLSQVEHLADILVAGIVRGELELVREPLEGPFLSRPASGLMSFRAIFSPILVSWTL